MTSKVKLIDPNTYGSAGRISSATFTRQVEFGGLRANLTRGGLIFVQALQWKGVQPRLVLRPGDAGYPDWRKLLDAAPESETTVRFVGAADAADNQIDQWLTHGPSPLLV